MALAFKIDPDTQAESRRRHLQAADSKRSDDNNKVALLPQVPQPAKRVSIAADAPTVTELPKKKPQLPLWLTILVRLQQGSTVVTGGLVAAALVIYSWTVYVDKMVGRTYLQLEALRTENQQVTTANETLKHNIAQQAAEAGAGFKPFHPKHAIFLDSAPSRLPSSFAEAEKAAPETQSKSQSETQPGGNPDIDAAEATMPYPLGY
ncbi:MAG: hypothetical protein AAF152_20825 [Cyanobacteria bacterium P01_A01_bin.114]